MGLKTILSALLPLASREQILGDLQELGFRRRDILGALPGAWIAHLRREWFGPVPSMADANEEALRLRAEQSRRAGLAEATFAIFVFALGWARLMRPDLQGLVIMVPAAIAATLFRLAMGGGPTPMATLIPSRGQLIADYRATLQRRVAGGMSFTVLPLLLAQVLRPAPESKVFFVACTVALSAITMYRGRRIHLELRNLTNPPRKNPIPLA
jgi:hypothetical protein